MFTLIENGEIYAPEPMGRTSVLLAGGEILKIGDVDTRALAQLDLPVENIDVSGCFVTPGLIDPHQHLLGGSGEEGFSSQTPEITAGELICGGITTILDQIRRAVEKGCVEFPRLVSLVTSNTASVLKLENKGKLDPGKAADVLVLRAESLELKDVIAGGKRLYRNGRLDFNEIFLEKSDRVINLVGEAR